MHGVKTMSDQTWSSPATEEEKPTAAEQYPNPLGEAASTPPDSQTTTAPPPPQSTGGAAAPAEAKATVEDARATVELGLRGLATMLGGPPPSPTEIEAVASPLAEGAPSWVWWWPVRLGAALAVFVWRRMPQPKPPQKGAVVDAPEPLAQHPAAPTT